MTYNFFEATGGSSWREFVAALNAHRIDDEQSRWQYINLIQLLLKLNILEDTPNVLLDHR